MKICYENFLKIISIKIYIYIYVICLFINLININLIFLLFCNSLYL